MENRTENIKTDQEWSKEAWARKVIWMAKYANTDIRVCQEGHLEYIFKVLHTGVIRIWFFIFFDQSDEHELFGRISQQCNVHCSVTMVLLIWSCCCCGKCRCIVVVQQKQVLTNNFQLFLSLAFRGGLFGSTCCAPTVYGWISLLVFISQWCNN